mgnify:CR=1 FL=1
MLTRDCVERFPDCDGIFLDIIMPNISYGHWGLRYMREQGIDANDPEQARATVAVAYERYFEKTTAAARSVRPDMPVFHNAGHIARGNRDVLRHYSHLELESLPTGGWGYDHFPLPARYVR